jgi:putative membrane protein
MMHSWNGAWGTGQWIAMWAFMAAFWLVLVAAVVVVARSFATRGDRADARDARDARDAFPDPQRILAERLARGEIDIDEYTRRHNVLGSR